MASVLRNSAAKATCNNYITYSSPYGITSSSNNNNYHNTSAPNNKSKNRHTTASGAADKKFAKQAVKPPTTGDMKQQAKKAAKKAHAAERKMEVAELREDLGEWFRDVQGGKPMKKGMSKARRNGQAEKEEGPWYM